jgi:hypothetical protein
MATETVGRCSGGLRHQFDQLMVMTAVSSDLVPSSHCGLCDLPERVAVMRTGSLLPAGALAASRSSTKAVVGLRKRTDLRRYRGPLDSKADVEVAKLALRKRGRLGGFDCLRS